jgi:phosphonate transport system substrate-binding protein
MDDQTTMAAPVLTRRQMLRVMMGGAAAAGLLAACGGAPAASAPTAAPAAAPTAAPAAAGAPASANLTEGSAEAGTFAGAPDLKGKLSLPKLSVAFIPAEDAAKTLSDNKDLLAYLKQVFGVEVTGAVGTSYSAVIEAQRAKKVDIAFYGPFSYILGNVEANAQALIQGETADGKLATYNSLIITQADSTLTSLADIKDKTFSFVDPASTSGHLVPSYTLLTKANLKESDYKPLYAGSHPASYQAVVNKKVDAGAIASDTFAKGVKEGSIDEKKVKLLDTSFPIPGSPIAIRGDIAPADQELIVQAFLAINDQPADSKLHKVALGGLGSGAVKLRKADDHAYDELRKIPAAIGIDIKGLVK